MPGSIRFDRAADEYDRTRAISDDAMARTIELLSSEFADRGRVLEVGVGTGLLALPLHRAGMPLAGIDLTPAMLGKLLDKAGGRPPFPLALADATAMPFSDRAFGGAFLRWVLHLISDWRGALREMVRVVRPGGVVLVNLGGFDDTRFEIKRRFAELTGISTDPVGLFWDDVDPLDAEMDRHRATLRILPPIRHEGDDTLEEFLDGIDQGRWSWTWAAPDEARRRAVRELRPWAVERYGPLDRVERYEFATVWRAYDLPGRGG
jgi:SAM-dependent methyltransferase